MPLTQANVPVASTTLVVLRVKALLGYQFNQMLHHDKLLFLREEKQKEEGHDGME
jgi:hypothetical protein